MVKLDEGTVTENTRRAMEYAESLRKRLSDYYLDSRKKARKRYGLCRTCFYLRNRIVGQAVTEYTCKNCEKTHAHHNTDVPNYCRECSEQFHVCQKCGASLE